MKKYYNTKPIDFTGCHPVIAEALKRGEEIECRVWAGEDSVHAKLKRYITGYIPGAYIIPGGVFWSHAEPIPRKVRRIMPPERAIPVLIAEGWQFNSAGHMCGPRQVILSTMFCHMGRRLDDPITISWSWPSCIIEEVEDDE